MSNIINADNGVVSGTAGVKLSSDSTGVLDIQTNGTTAITISTAQVVSLTNSPTFTGGTANGVLFLNASKVATSGSALVFDGTNFASTGSLTGSTLKTTRASGAQPEIVLTQTSVASWSIYNPPASTDLRFYNGSDLLTLASSGNLGLGVTPSTWSSGKAYETTAAGHALWALSNEINVTQNAYFNSGWKYGATAAAARYQQQSGEHKWNIAASGTAGNAISFTQAMTLTAAGNLLVGATTAPSGGLPNILSANSAGGGVQFHHTSSGGGGLIGGVASGGLLFYTYTGSIGSESYTERARITSTGALFVGTTSAVGTETAGSVHIIGGPNNNNTGPLFIRNTFATAGRYWKVGPVNDNGFIVFNQDGTGAFVANGGTSWTANSDERIKDIIEPITNAAAKVCGLRAVIGKYKTDEESKRRSFLIAQDVQAVLPEAVTVQNDEIGTLGLAYTEVIPLLVAAIQEQQAIITQLTARITALEGT